jgi:hypothetical protein
MTTVPEPYPIASIRSNFPSESYYSGCKSLVKKVNAWLELPIADTVYPQAYEDNYDDIVQLILDNMVIRNHKDLLSKMATLNASMKFAGYDDGKFQRLRMQLGNIPIEIKPQDKNVPDWKDLSKLLAEKSVNCNSPGGRIVASAYKHHYVLRVGEIFQTCIVDKPQYNFLDTKNLVWYVRAQCTKNNRDREFPVSQNFIDEILPNVSPHGFLIYRKCGLPHRKGSHTMRISGLLGVPPVPIIRNSFETWNHARTDVDQAEKDRCSHILGHSVQTAICHYTPDILSNKIIIRKNNKIKPVIRLKIHDSQTS